MLPKAHLTSHSSLFYIVSHWHNQIHRKLWTCVSEAAAICTQCGCQNTWGPKLSLNIENTYIPLKTGVYSLQWSQVTPESHVMELLGWRCGWNWGSHNLRPSPCMEQGPAPRTRRTGPPGVSQGQQGGRHIASGSTYASRLFLALRGGYKSPAHRNPCAGLSLPKGEGVGVGGTLHRNNPGHSTVC